MKKPETIIGILIVVLTVAYLLLHRKAPSTISKNKLDGVKDYPQNPLPSDEAEAETPDYLLTNQPTRHPIRTIDLTGNDLADSMSLENLQTAILVNSSAVN